jgi:hypothetical protein
MGFAVPEQGPPRRSARPPGGKAVGITLAPGPARTAALAIVGVPFVVLMIIGLKTASWGGGLPVPLFEGGGGAQSPQIGAQSPVGGSYTPYSPYSGASPGYGASATAAPGDFGTPTPSAPPAGSSAAAIVQKAYRAINRRDYRLAYALGLAAPGQSYAEFAAGYRGTASVILTVDSAQGGNVMVGMTAIQKDGTEKLYSGTYTVVGGHITSAQIQPAG